ncbi:MAG TPA: amidase [Streptosporangiaceae bacterium]
MTDLRDPRHVITGTNLSVGSVTVAQLRAALDSGALTPVALTDYYLARITRLNPALHAVITVNPSAREEAAAAAAGPLSGIPVLIKDNVGVAGMPTTAGSPALLSSMTSDAFGVAKLRAAGAVILGKANLSEWANFRSSHSASGWSTLGGQTVNPYALDRNPSGSSSGSAAGVAAGLAPLAVGTETDGSIVAPASACGIVGIKPTIGLISRHGIVPISPVQDTAGPMAGSVADAALMLSVMAGPDPRDPIYPEQQWDPGALVSSLDPGALDGARLAIWRAPSAGAPPAVVAVLDEAVGRMRSLGAIVDDPVDLPEVDGIGEPEYGAMMYEFKYGINAYLAYVAAMPGYTGPSTLAELIDFNKRNSSLVLARFGQEIFEQAEATSGLLDDPGYVALRRSATSQARSALSVLSGTCDAIVSLTAGPAWLTDYVLGDRHELGSSSPAAVAGYPAITVPGGYVSGLPVGITFTGAQWSEPRLLALAYAFEQAGSPRRPPALAATVPLSS